MFIRHQPTALLTRDTNPVPRASSQRPLLARLVMAIAAIGLFFVSYQWGNKFQRTQDRPARIEGILLHPTITFPQVRLHGTRGTLATEDLQDQWSLIAFGSPGSAAGHRAVARMIDVWNRLADKPALRGQLLLLLISADDAPRLASELERLSPQLRVLSTSRSELNILRSAVGAGPMTETQDDDGPPPVFLVGPSAQLMALFPSTQPAQGIAVDIAALFDQPRPAEPSAQRAAADPAAPDPGAND